jgi:hypothetical protein
MFLINVLNQSTNPLLTEWLARLTSSNSSLIAARKKTALMSPGKPSSHLRGWR